MSKKEPFGIYIHIPYCKAKCRYCDFYSAPGARGVPQSYGDALCTPKLMRVTPAALNPRSVSDVTMSGFASKVISAPGKGAAA